MSELFESELEALRAAVADHNRELAAMASWQQRMRARVEKAEAAVSRVKALADDLDAKGCLSCSSITGGDVLAEILRDALEGREL